MRLLVNGRLLTSVASGREGEHRWGMGPAEGDWIVAEVRAEDDSLLAVTNPIFLESEGPSG